MPSNQPCPWGVHTGKLRPQFPARIVEVIDANGATVLPWGSFDATGLRHRQQKELAERIVIAVNMRELRNTHEEAQRG